MACVSLSTYVHPLDSHKDIVFQYWNGDQSLEGGLGLLNADGSGFELLPSITDVEMPIWSFDKKEVAYKWVFDRQQSDDYGFLTFYGKITVCDKYYFYGRLKWASSGLLIISNQGSGNSLGYSRQIVLWDVDKCQTNKMIYKEETPDFFEEPDYSITGNVVFTRRSADKRSIVLFDEKTAKPVKIADGFGGSWSPDGTKIVYTGARGLYISDMEGTKTENVVDLTEYYPVENNAIIYDEWPPMAVWSPDSKYLAFHRKSGNIYTIVKVELSSGLETVLFEGGMYPDWR
jgi:Tol biopolymer transport system component